MTRIVVLGDLNLDISVSLPDRLIPGGEFRTEILSAPGGAAANFACAAARLGAEVVFIGCAGTDPVGDSLVAELKKIKIETHVKRVALPTGTIIALTDGVERTMLCSRGANDRLDAPFINPSWFDGARHLHLSGYAVLSSGQTAAARRALAIAKNAGMSISLTAPPPNLIQNFGVEAFIGAIASVDWLFLNRDEGKTITGAERAEDIVTVLSRKFTAGALTLGKDGSLAWDGDDHDRSMTTPLASVDSTGAGDAFAAGFIVDYLRHHDLGRANRRALDTALVRLQRRVSPV